MRILVTGGCGFIGSNFINYYKAKHRDKAFIINLDKLDYCSSSNGVHHDLLVVGNLQDKDLVLKVLEENQVDIVIHFAAQTHVDNSFGNSIEFTKDNILGTHTLLECCRVYNKIQKFVHISTDEVYGEVGLNHAGCSEKSLLNPTNPYAATKAGAEFIARSYFYSFGLPVVITRGNNVYGPRQYPEKVIPKFIDLLSNGKPCPVQGTGESRRNFIHVQDVARAVELIMHHGMVNKIYNIGSGNEFSVLDIVQILVEEIIGKEHVHCWQKWVRYVEDRNFNDYRYAIDSTALRELGWTETIDFREGLKSTIQWYFEHGITCWNA